MCVVAYAFLVEHFYDIYCGFTNSGRSAKPNGMADELLNSRVRRKQSSR